VTDTTADSITLQWTAPGDDGNTGTASQYDLRYREGTSLTADNWNSSTQASTEPAPKATSSAETFTVGGLQTDKTYFRHSRLPMRYPTGQEISNVADGKTRDTIPPSAVSDLWSSDSTNSITITWTAPGDDGNVGTASSMISDMPKIAAIEIMTPGER
jgi:hypothetical protein